MFKLIILDYDGVIVDSFPAIHSIYQEVCAELGFSCPSDFEEFRRLYGKHSGQFMKNIGMPDSLRQAVSERYYPKLLAQSPPAFNGISEVLLALQRRCPLVLLTANFQDAIEARVTALGLRQYFAEIAGKTGHDSIFYKDSLIAGLLERHGATPEETLFIGDRDVDYEAAQKAGIRSIILVSYGWERTHSYPVSHAPVRSPAEILRAIEELETVEDG